MAGFGVAEFGGGQVGQEQGDGAVMDGRGHAVDADGQRARGVVGLEVRAGDEQLADQGAGFGFVGEMLRNSPTSAVSAR